MFVLLSTSVFACVTPIDGDVFDSSVTFCNDVFYLDQGISVQGDNVTLDCSGAIIRGSYRGAGIEVQGDGVQVSDCRILNYETAFLVRNSSRVKLVDNHLIRNLHSASLIRVNQSSFFNYDISLGVPFVVAKSAGNVLSSQNGFVSGDFCSSNFCNRPRDVVEFHVLKKDDPSVFRMWFLSNLLPGSLHGSIWSGLTDRNVLH